MFADVADCNVAQMNVEQGLEEGSFMAVASRERTQRPERDVIHGTAGEAIRREK